MSDSDSPALTPPSPTGGDTGGDGGLRVLRGLGAAVGYGSLVAFLWLISLQVYRWFREGEWTHIGVTDGLRVLLGRCCGVDGDGGRVAAFVHWLDAPTDWLGLHKVLEVVPASLALFALSILGNGVFLYCRDRIEGGGAPSQT